MAEWIRSHTTALWCLSALSIVTFVATLIVVPWLIVRIPADYFVHDKPHRTPRADRHPAVRSVSRIGKNVIGYVFIVAGIAMLVLPGQGILTILVAITLLDLPGKHRLQRWVIARPPVLRSMNRLRRRAGRAPLVL